MIFLFFFFLTSKFIIITPLKLTTQAKVIFIRLIIQFFVYINIIIIIKINQIIKSPSIPPFPHLTPSIHDCHEQSLAPKGNQTHSAFPNVNNRSTLSSRTA
jgi:hypothetical protein